MNQQTSIFFVVDRLEELIRGRRWVELRESLEHIAPQELAVFLLEIDKEDRVLILRSLERHRAFEIFSYLEPDQQDDLLRDLTDTETRQFLASLSPDDRTALLEELPAKMTRRLMTLFDKSDLAEARELLGYPEESVGRLMTPDYVDVRPQWTIGQALDHIRQHGKDSETIMMIYVTDENDILIDDIKLRYFILANPADTVESLMDRSYVSLSAFDDREKAVQLIERFDLVALPVVDSDGEMLGIVTVDDVIDVAEEEVTEDIHKSVSVSPLKMSYRRASIPALYLKRVGWLVMLVVLNLGSASVIAAYEEKLAEMVVLLFFIPLLIASGGNAGSQSATLIIRAMVTGDVRMDQWARTFGKEIAVGAMLGLTLAAVGGLLGFLHGGLRFDIMLVVALAMLSIVVVGNVVGMVLPFLLARLKLDPAIASGPLITTIADASGLLIYFSIATSVIGL